METLLLPRQVAIPTSEIIYLQSDSNYTKVFTRNKGKNHFVALTLCKIQASLTPDNFVRVNRSHLINTRYVKTYQVRKKHVFVTLKNGTSLTSSRRRTTAVLKILSINC